MRDLIKKVLLESSAIDVEVAEKEHTKKLDRIKKITPKMARFFKESLSDYNLYDISIGSQRTSYGSTIVYDSVTGERYAFSGEIVVLTLRFVDLNYSQTRGVRKKVFDYVNDVFGIPFQDYGVPLTIKFINLEEKEF